MAALWLADELDIGPGPVMAVLGGVVFAIVAGGAAMTLVRVDGLTGGYAPGADVLDGVSFALEAGHDRRRARAQRRRQDDAVPRAARRAARAAAGPWSWPARPAYVPQTDRARLDFPVSALDVVLMGAYGRTPAGGGSPAPTATRRGPRSSASGSPTAPARASARCRAASASAC